MEPLKGHSDEEKMRKNVLPNVLQRNFVFTSKTISNECKTGDGNNMKWQGKLYFNVFLFFF